MGGEGGEGERGEGGEIEGEAERRGREGRALESSQTTKPIVQ